MSKVSIEFDTVTDKLVVAVDGKKIPQEIVTTICFYNYTYSNGEMNATVSIETLERPAEENEGDLTKIVRLVANHNEDIKRVETNEKPVQHNIAALLDHYRSTSRRHK